MEEQWHKVYRGAGFLLMDVLSSPAWEVWTKLAYCTRPYDNTVYKPRTDTPMSQQDIAKFVGKKERQTREALTELVGQGVLTVHRERKGNTYKLHDQLCRLGRGSPVGGKSIRGEIDEPQLGEL